MGLMGLTKIYSSQRRSKLQSEDEKRKSVTMLIAVADPEKGFTGACLVQEDRRKSSLGVCEYLFHTREPVSNDKEKVIFQQKNVYSSLEFWRDALLFDGDVVVISDLAEEHFSRDIRIIRHELKLKRESKGFTGAIQIVPYDESPVYYVPPPRTATALLSLPTHGHANSCSSPVQIEDESWLPILQICQHAAQALSAGSITRFKQLLIGNQINVQKFTRIPQFPVLV